MQHKILALVVMSGVAILLASALDIVQTGTPGWALLICSWLVVVAINLMAAWHMPTARLAWMKLILVEGVIGAVVAATAFAMPALAASFEPGADWHSLDLSPPLAARLRESMMSGYFALAMIVIAAALFAIAYFLSDKDSKHGRHAH